MQPNVSPSVGVVSWEEENKDVVVHEVHVVEHHGGILRKAAITAAFVAVDSTVLYAGTVIDWTFMHRSTLFLIGIATGIAWTLAVLPRKVTT